MPRGASRPAPSRAFAVRVGRLVDVSQPGLARWVPKAPALVVRRPSFVGTTRLVAFADPLAFSGQEGDRAIS
jgi:hypothetical protein